MTALAWARIGVGATEVVAPGRLGSAALGRPPDARERAALRVLGARHLAQYVATRRGHDVLGGPGLDALHAASMVGLAVLSRRYRRSALTSAAAASGFALAAARVRAPRTSPG